VDAIIDAARALAGLTLPELAARGGLSMPASLARSKGFIGQAVERALGLPMKTGPGPDLPGLEIKTLPVELAVDTPRSVESTFVCTVQRDRLDIAWADSAPRSKLGRVLFVPIEAKGDAHRRRVGTAFVWSPTEEDDARLAADWDAITAQLLLHGHDRITGRLGTIMQVRPKAANAASRALSRDDTGALSRALPRAFYLRRPFTTELLGRTGLR
jgi:DNA mismatch repair protein MutH